jgi:hypothetical protein
MPNLKRLAVALSSALTFGVGAVLVLSATAPGATALRGVANNLAVAAHAAGLAGGDGTIAITISPTASLTAKLAASVPVNYTCKSVIDPATGNVYVSFSSSLYVQVLERQGKVIAHGSGFINDTAVCDDTGFNPTPTVNHATVVVIPDFFSSPAFKHGAALASVNVSACPVVPVFTSPPFFPPCDFGNAGPTVISIK